MVGATGARSKPLDNRFEGLEDNAGVTRPSWGHALSKALSLARQGLSALGEEVAGLLRAAGPHLAFVTGRRRH